MIEKIFQDIDDLKAELDQIQFPNGAREAPARSCKDLYLAHPEFKDGKYDHSSRSGNCQWLLCVMTTI